MTGLLELIQILNGISPLGIIALLVAIVWMLLRGQRESAQQMKTIGDNHLHEIPELVQNTRHAADTLGRIEVKLGENFAAIHAKLDKDK